MTTIRAGDVVADKYRIEKLLGKGGMGSVFQAHHIHLDQRVAIKFLNALAIDDFEAKARFQQEARAAVRFKSEHVAQVYDVGIHRDAEPYIVMEYLEGSDLSNLLSKVKRISVTETVEYVLQACEALAEAHAMSIIHRDIKLANLFVTRGPGGAKLLKLLDFGISKTLTGEPGGMTKTSAMLGSPKFMSPEQMTDARLVDARTDIYSLGVVLYRLTSGQAPFDADTVPQLLALVMRTEARPLRSLLPDLPPGFETVVAQAMEKDRARRPPTVAHLAAALIPFAPDRKAAKERVEVISRVLGIPAPLPTSTAQPANRPSRDDAWAHTHSQSRSRTTSAPPPPLAHPMMASPYPPSRSSPPPSLMSRIQNVHPVLASVAALGLALLFGTFVIVQKVERERASIAKPIVVPPPPPPPVVVPLPPVTPVITAAPPPPSASTRIRTRR